MTRLAALLAAILATPAVALAAPPDVAADQISSGSRSVSTPAAGEGAVVATEQIAGRSSARAPSGASTRGQGRVGLDTHAIGGRDRCADPSRRPSEACENTVERRSADFAQPRPEPLTAEQRLLIQLQTGEDAEHRLQRGQPGQSQAADALAGALTQTPAPEPTPAPTTLDPAIQSAVDAAMGITVTVTPPPSH